MKRKKVIISHGRESKDAVSFLLYINHYQNTVEENFKYLRNKGRANMPIYCRIVYNKI